MSFAGLLVLALSPLLARAQTFEPTLTVGGGIQGSYDHTQPDGSNSTDQFSINHLRLYFNGDITKNISAMVNTEYDSSSNKIGVLDAVGEIHTTPSFNIWFGRFLPPSDRA
ncbi:MAG: porin, partial [Candidatus Acidiferrales bacterium]